MVINSQNINLFVRKVEEWVTIFFFCASIFVLIFLTQALLLMWLNQFKIVYILICFLISFILTIVFLRFIKNGIKLIPHLNLAVLLVIFLISLILILFPHDCFGGRDEGYYSGLAIILSKYHSISVPSYLFKVPLLYGISEQTFSLTTPTYVVWLAAQKVLFGTGWMLRSNVVLIFLGLCSLFLVSSLITKKSLGFVTVLLFSTCMPFLWFSRETMTENMAFFLIWTSIIFLFTFFKTKRNIYLVGLFLCTWLFSFTRAEGFFIQFTTFLVFSSILLIVKIFSLKKNLLIILIYLLVIGSTLLISNHFNYDSYLREAVIDINRLFKKSTSSVLITEIRKQNKEIINKDVKLEERIPVFSVQMLAKYNLVLILFSIFLIIPLIVVDKKMGFENKIYLIGLLIILSPEFLKFIDPAVTMEQPWMYRRYIYALLPMGYLSFSIFLNKFNSRRILVFLTVIFFIINIILSSKIITLKNNWLITEKVEKLTQNISAKDFVIVEGYILGSYGPATYMVYHKEVRNLYKWWIEAGDWLPKEKKFGGLSYERLFLLSDLEDTSYKNFKLSTIDSVEIKSTQLVPNCKLYSLILQLKSVGSPRLLPYQDVIVYCSKTENEILEVKKKIFLYELIYEGT